MHLTGLAAELKPSALCSCQTLFAITAAGHPGFAGSGSWYANTMRRVLATERRG
jgi:hypothetical protein